MGRPTKYSEAVVQRLTTAIRLGATYAAACGYAGISDDTLANWRTTKSGFSERLARAEGEATVRWLTKINHAATDDWRAAAWMLERRYPREYGRNVTELQGRNGGKPLNFTLDIRRVGDLDVVEAFDRKVLDLAKRKQHQEAVEAAERVYLETLTGKRSDLSTLTDDELRV